MLTRIKQLFSPTQRMATPESAPSASEEFPEIKPKAKTIGWGYSSSVSPIKSLQTSPKADTLEGARKLKRQKSKVDQRSVVKHLRSSDHLLPSQYDSVEDMQKFFNSLKRTRTTKPVSYGTESHEGKYSSKDPVLSE